MIGAGDAMQSDSSPHCISDPIDVQAMLGEIHAQGAQLGIHPKDGADRPHMAKIASFSRTGMDLLVSDEAIDQIHIFADPRTRVVACTRCGQVEFPLDSSTPPRPQPGNLVHVTRPERLYQSDRRRGQRVLLPSSLSGTCQVRVGSGRTERLVVRDLSFSGVRLVWPGDQPAPAIGTIWRYCLIRIDGAPALAVDMAVVRRAQAPDNGAIEIGCHFDRLPLPIQSQLQQIVIFLDAVQRQEVRTFADFTQSVEPQSRHRPTHW